MKYCSVRDCDEIRKSKGYCNKHYQKWKKYDDPLHSIPRITTVCSVKNCKNKHCAKGYCKQHYKRWKRYDDPLHFPTVEETRQKMSNAKKGIIPWNKGKKGIFSEDSLKKMSDSQKKNAHAHFKKGKENPMYGKTGKKNPFYGRKHSEESIEKQRKKKLGKKASDETRRKMSETRKGKKLSKSWIENISKAKKGKKNPMYGKTGEQSPFFGRKHTEEVKRQKSIQSKEFANRPEIKQALRETLRKTRHNQVKPNKKELQIKKILTDAKINFKMFVNVKFNNIQNEPRQHESDFLILPNKIIEHNGTYDHADPRKYNADDKIRDKIAKDIWKNEKNMLKGIRKQGYKVLVVWQNDLEKDTENATNKILKFAKS